MNTFGSLYRLTSFGESHGPAIGGIIDGIPSGIEIDITEIQTELDRRRPGLSPATSTRKETDRLKILSGLMAIDPVTNCPGPLTPETEKAVTLGTPIGFMVENHDARSADYDNLRDIFRPSHADFAWQQKFGIRDWRGGGRASGRETISRVVAGAFARQILSTLGITITATLESVGNAVNPDDFIAEAIKAKSDGDSVGATIKCTIQGCPVGLGEPTFGKLQQTLASAMLSIGAAKGFEYGMGFEGSTHRGSEVADRLTVRNGQISTVTNHSGGIQGGISNGEEIYFRVAVKPTPTISQPLAAATTACQPTTLCSNGRHDPCIGFRAIPVVEAMTAMTLLDAWMLNRSHRL